MFFKGLGLWDADVVLIKRLGKQLCKGYFAKMADDKTRQYIYIVQASLEPSKCKIGKTNDLERRLSDYNNMTGKSKENVYRYLFTCEVQDMTQVENDILSTGL